MSKYGNRKTIVDGITFDSAKEAKRYGELKLLERAGEIAGIELQPRFKLVVRGIVVCTYVGDFQYLNAKGGGIVVEDVKGFKTREYKLKAKLFKALFGFGITEI